MSGSRTRRWKRPESVLVVVYTATADVLLLRRREPPDFWQSVTGSLEWGEDPRSAALRELHEETGIDGLELQDCRKSRRFPIIPPWRARYAPDTDENEEHVFSLRLAQRVPPTLNPAEHTEFLWLPRDAAAARVWSWTNRDAILTQVGVGDRADES
ncbi:MAG: dihydroneopterin triphosphate diphosphatase [Thiotrichales bacterium]